MSAGVPINFNDYNLSVEKSGILTATPKKGGTPAVKVNLNNVVGNSDGKLVFGGKNFSKTSESVKIQHKNGANYLVASCVVSGGGLKKSDLKLDGALQITIPATAAAQVSIY
jgi:hypothetical protein